jgi:hypothetical protein
MSLSALINIFLGIMAIYAITVYCVDFKSCSAWLVAGITINLLVLLGQVLGFNPIITDLPHDIGGKVLTFELGGIMGNAPRLSMLMALTTPFLGSVSLISFCIMGLAMKEISLVIVALAMLIVINKSWLRYIIIALAIGTIVYYYRQIFASLSFRSNIWQDTILGVCRRPWSGLGLGYFSVSDFCFSSFLQWIYGVGIAGFIFICYCFKKINIYLIPLAILCLIKYPFEVQKLWLVICFAIASYFYKKEETKCW